jgi:Uri superfamily endonuclease
MESNFENGFRPFFVGSVLNGKCFPEIRRQLLKRRKKNWNIAQISTPTFLARI